MAADFFLLLGAAVVKAAVRLWAGGLVADASDPIIDLLTGEISDDRERRRLGRFFEDLEEPVAKRLQALQATEFRGLPDNEWTAAVLAARDSFDNAKTTVADLVSWDLNPLLLKRQILSRSPQATRDLSEGGTELYIRLIGEGSAQMIEIADKLPRFQPAVFTELLRRTTQIRVDLERALTAIPAGSAGVSSDAQFGTDCRRNIVTRFDRLELFGVDFESSWYPLDVAYVSLRTEGHIGGGGQAIEDRLAENSRVLLLGRAGSGKTTVLQWLAIRSARSDFPGALADLNEYFPFFIRLREYEGKALPEPEDFLKTTAPALAGDAPPRWAHAQLRSGRALVLVDGVDELPADQRDDVSTWLRGLVEAFPDVRYVVTARPTAVSPKWLAEMGFVGSSLEAMPPELVESFVRRWHEAVRRQLADDEERERLDDYERSLLGGIKRDRYVRDLADTPLLAGLLCALNRNLRANLPRRRTEIYARALTMFDQRDRARRIKVGEPMLDQTAKTFVLADLALWMIRNGKSEVDSTTATVQVSRSLARLTGQAHGADAVFRYLLERSSLLREPTVGHVDFVHRTFQEYLAGKAAIDGDAIGELVRMAGDDQWGEVVVLAAGQANQVQAGDLIRGLLGRNWRGQRQYSRRTMAVACLQEAVAVDADLRADVESTIPSLLPPRSMYQAEQLAAAGEPLIPLLARHWSRDPVHAKETIRAASLIGGLAAMDLIRELASSDGVRYIGEELGRAWQYFNVDDFAQSVLAAGQAKDVTISSARFLRALAQVPSIRDLSLSWNEDSEISLRQVALPQVRNLSIKGRITDWGWLAAWTQLIELAVFNYGRRDLSSLPNLPELSALHLWGSAKLVSLSGIERQPTIAKVLLYRCEKLPSLIPLNELPMLKELTIWHMPNIDLPALESTRETLVLHLHDCGDVDLSVLRNAHGTTVYYGGGTRVRNADALGEGSSVTRQEMGVGRRKRFRF